MRENLFAEPFEANCIQDVHLMDPGGDFPANANFPVHVPGRSGYEGIYSFCVRIFYSFSCNWEDVVLSYTTILIIPFERN
jgi:hypothetical protein